MTEETDALGDNAFIKAADGEAFRQLDAITLTDNTNTPESIEKIVKLYLEYCRKNNITPAL